MTTINLEKIMTRTFAVYDPQANLTQRGAKSFAILVEEELSKRGITIYSERPDIAYPHSIYLYGDSDDKVGNTIGQITCGAFEQEGILIVTFIALEGNDILLKAAQSLAESLEWTEVITNIPPGKRNRTITIEGRNGKHIQR